MKVVPVILCGGSGSRLWPGYKKYQAKQFIDFGGWTLFDKTLERIKHPIFDFPIISTNSEYVSTVKKHLKKNRISKYKIVVEPQKKNTAAAILSSSLLSEINIYQPIIFFSSDHYISNFDKMINVIKLNDKYLDNENICVFGIKPKKPSSLYGYIVSKDHSTISKVIKFVEKPSLMNSKKIIKRGGYINAGIFFAKKISIIKNFKQNNKKILTLCLKSYVDARIKDKIIYLNKKYYAKLDSISFDYAVIEKCKNLLSLNINLNWNDLGSWSEIFHVLKKKKTKSFLSKNTFYRPWGKYVNIFKGKNFLLKEISVNPKASLSLQKHLHRSEVWKVFKGNPLITINSKKITANPEQQILIPLKAKHRIENKTKNKVTIIEAQLGSILKETDIIRYQDVYGRVNK